MTFGDPFFRMGEIALSDIAEFLPFNQGRQILHLQNIFHATSIAEIKHNEMWVCAVKNNPLVYDSNENKACVNLLLKIISDNLDYESESEEERLAIDVYDIVYGIVNGLDVEEKVNRVAEYAKYTLKEIKGEEE